MKINDILNEFFESRELELKNAKFKKIYVFKKPALMVYNNKQSFIIKHSIKKFSRFRKWDGLIGKNTSIQPLIGRYVLIDKKPIQLCNIATEVYQKEKLIDSVESKDNKEEERI